MSTCLGIYLEKNLIKYAKLTKNNDDIKIDSYGIKFYDDINKTIQKIVEETYSFNIPISINVSEEMYNYFEVFSGLTKRDMDIAINTEFELLCSEKGYKTNVYEARHILANSLQERTKIIHVSANKAEIERKIREFEGLKLKTITVLPVSISNLNDEIRENVAIINIEEKTSITIFNNGKINDVAVIKLGMEEILDALNLKVNSYTKAYEICKNSTIYTQNAKDLVIEQNEYLEDIMPILYKIVTECSTTIKSNEIPVDKIYITGTAAIINNIDFYFTEYMGNIKCELLKPGFIKDIGALQINIKDYIEVNSAISLALQGLDSTDYKQLNFKTLGFLDKLPTINSSSKSKEQKSDKPKKERKINIDFGGIFNRAEKSLIRTLMCLTVLVIMYAVGVIIINNQMTQKIDEVNIAIEKVNAQIKEIESDTAKTATKTSQYNKLTQNLKDLTSRTINRYKDLNAIPNLLNQIMAKIPRNVKVTSIKNESERKVTISVESTKYEELGYFKARLKADNILLNVTSDSATKEAGVIRLVIKGDLP